MADDRKTPYTVAGVVLGSDAFTVRSKQLLPVGWSEGATSVNWWSQIKNPEKLANKVGDLGGPK